MENDFRALQYSLTATAAANSEHVLPRSELEQLSGKNNSGDDP